MPRQIIKADKRVDLYIEWSSVVEAPTFIGSREEMLRHLLNDYRPDTERYISELAHAQRRLDAADWLGTSAPKQWGCGWDDHGEVYQQKGVLLRSDMLTAAILWRHTGEKTSESMIEALLEPFDANALGVEDAHE